MVLINDIDGFFPEEKGINRPAKNINDIINGLRLLHDKTKSKDFDALVITNYLFTNIASEAVRKRKATAREFEDFLAFFLNGVVTDEKIRANANINLGNPSGDQEIDRYVISNRREKGDVEFNGYKISVKTLVPSNLEMNWGSFAKEALFKGILEKTEYGSERKGGLGSGPQLIKNIFNPIIKKGIWEKFKSRFSFMINEIFKDDYIIFIKGGNYFEIFVIPNEKIREIFKKHINKDPHYLTKVFYRYEGHCIRGPIKPFIKEGKMVRINVSDCDFNYLKIMDSTIKEIEKILSKAVKKEINANDLIKEIVKIIEEFIGKIYC